MEKKVDLQPNNANGVAVASNPNSYKKGLGILLYQPGLTHDSSSVGIEGNDRYEYDKFVRKHVRDSVAFRKLRLSSKYPNWSNSPLSDGSSVLHVACKINAPFDVVNQIIDVNPKALQQRDGQQCYPLHVACQNYQSDSVIELLVKKYPAAVKTRAKGGIYPLHLACRYYQSEYVIQLLYQTYPDPVKIPIEGGYFPLHLACRYHNDTQSNSLISSLVDTYPAALQTSTTDTGDFPLHLACGGNASLPVIEYLVNKWPEGMTQKNINDESPLDYAKNPFYNENPNKDTVQWLENRMKDELIDQQHVSI